MAEKNITGDSETTEDSNWTACHFIGQNVRNLQWNAACDIVVYLAADDKAEKFGGLRAENKR
jgi:hypothetical protein